MTRYQVRPARSFATRTTPTFVRPASTEMTREAADGPDRSRSAVVVTRWPVTVEAVDGAGFGFTACGAGAATVAMPVWRNAVNGVVSARTPWTRTPLTSVEMAIPFPR